MNRVHSTSRFSEIMLCEIVGVLLFSSPSSSMKTFSLEQQLAPVSADTCDEASDTTTEAREIRQAQARLHGIFAREDTVFVEGGAELPWYPDR